MNLLSSKKHILQTTWCETFAVKLLQIVVSDVSHKQVLARILLIELTKIINFSRLNVTKNVNLWCHKFTRVLLSKNAVVKYKQHLVLLIAKLSIICSASIPVTTCHCRKAHKKRNVTGLNGVRLAHHISVESTVTYTFYWSSRNRD